MADETNRTKKIDMNEIEELARVPEIKEFLIQAVEDAKEKFKDQIDQIRKTAFPSIKDGESRDKSYFFDLNRIEDPESEIGYKWELGRFNLKAQKEIADMILSQFIKKVDEYEAIPQQMQNKIFKSPILGKSFNITFMKNSETRVTGFVEEIEEDEQKNVSKYKEQYILKNGRGMVKVPAKHAGLAREELYQNMFRLMEEDEKVRNDIFFYYLMVQKSREESSGETEKD
jgi:DNA-binding phage protein